MEAVETKEQATGQSKGTVKITICKSLSGIAEGAELEIIETQAGAWCFSCDEAVVIEQRYDPCPKCGGHQLTVTGGEELKIKQISIKE